jgi:uncharacterized membrane protein
MNIKRFRQIRVLITLCTGAIVAIAVISDSFLLALFGVLTGMLFLILVRSKTRITVDERERTIREKAAQLTYAIYAPALGIAALLLTFLTKFGYDHLGFLGTVLSYLTLLLIAIYAISFYFLNRKYSGRGDEE